MTRIDHTNDSIVIAHRLKLPKKIKAILWDLDGALIDSLTLDFKLCNELLERFIGPGINLPLDFLYTNSAFDVPLFWKKNLEEVRLRYQLENALDYYSQILPIYDRRRQSEPFPLNPGVREILEAISRSKELKQAIVSNNPTKDVLEIMENSGLAKPDFDLVVGNDLKDQGHPLAKKPAPDTYLFAAKKLALKPEECAVIEDSLIGVAGAISAGCYVVAVATGSADIKDLVGSRADLVYKSFAL